jgi:hypothetical protein
MLGLVETCFVAKQRGQRTERQRKSRGVDVKLNLRIKLAYQQASVCSGMLPVVSIF